jgi:transcription termination factor NusB
MNSFIHKSSKDYGIFSWIPVKKLTKGDILVLNNHKNIEWPGDGDWADGYLLGWLYGDGSCDKTNHDKAMLIFCKNDRMMINFVIKLFGEKEFTCNYNTSGNFYYLESTYLNALQELFNIDHKKIITQEIERASSDFYKGFISGFFDTDSSVDSRMRRISLTQANLSRLQAVQRMLLRLNIFSKIYKRGNIRIRETLKKSYTCKQDYFLKISGNDAIEFYKRIGFKNPEKNEKLLETIKSSKREYLQYFLVTVKSINLIGKKTVYDVTVPGKDCFDANGFMAHNCSMRQPGGIGTKVEWAEPDEYIESLLGFKRYFTMENQIVKALFNLANDPPKEWLRMNIKVTRRDREQSAGGALRSALFAAAFAQQSANMRAAANHVIQSSGAQITKRVQRNIWDIQPSGINPWRVQPINIHDEVLSPTHPDFVNQVKEVVDKTVESFREKVPLIKMDWKSNLKNWADKK